jgi:hypothetical protein
MRLLLPVHGAVEAAKAVGSVIVVAAAVGVGVMEVVTIASTLRPSGAGGGEGGVRTTKPGSGGSGGSGGGGSGGGGGGGSGGGGSGGAAAPPSPISPTLYALSSSETPLSRIVWSCLFIWLPTFNGPHPPQFAACNPHTNVVLRGRPLTLIRMKTPRDWARE